MPVLDETIRVDGAPGKYRFAASFTRAAAAMGGQAEFYVADAEAMPPLETEVVLWGTNAPLVTWLNLQGIPTRPFDPDRDAPGEVILVADTPPADGAFEDLLRHIESGATAVFLCPEIFKKGDDPVGWLPLEPARRTEDPLWLALPQGRVGAKRHPIFDGLPAGGLLDYTYYHELIPDRVWAGQAPPAEAVAGANKTSQGYDSGLLVAVYKRGEGRFVLNTLRILDNLGRHPAAERLLRNMLCYAVSRAE